MQTFLGVRHSFLPPDEPLRTFAREATIFAYSSTREQSHERSGARLKTESETGERRACEARALRGCEALELR